MFIMANLKVDLRLITKLVKIQAFPVFMLCNFFVYKKKKDSKENLFVKFNFIWKAVKVYKGNIELHNSVH